MLFYLGSANSQFKWNDWFNSFNNIAWCKKLWNLWLLQSTYFSYLWKSRTPSGSSIIGKFDFIFTKKSNENDLKWQFHKFQILGAERNLLTAALFEQRDDFSLEVFKPLSPNLKALLISFSLFIIFSNVKSWFVSSIFKIFDR